MSHEITQTDNMFSVRAMPWHGLGAVLPEYPSRREAQQIAHNWEPIPEPVYRKVPHITADGDLATVYEEIENVVEQRRSDTGDHLGVVSDTYVTVKNDEMYDVAEAIQGGGVDVKFETGGSLNGGKRVWLMLTLQDPIVLTGDKSAVLPFYLLQNDHTGGGSFRGSATTVRVVCANTVRAADLDSSMHGTEFAFAHTKNVADRVEQARAALRGWRTSVDEFKQLAELMIEMPVSKAGEREFVERFIPAPLSPLTSDRVKQNIETARAELWECYNGITGDGIRGTAWGLTQAAAEWSEHMRKAKGNQRESRFKRAMLNSNSIITTARVLAQEAARV